MCGGGGTQERKADAEVKVANEDPSKAKFTTKHGSQGVTNPDYAAYVRKHPDLMANYNKRWKKGAPDPLSQNNAGISLAEYGAMHYAKYGRKEGRAFPGKSGGGGGGGGGGGDPDGGILGPYPEPNIYFPMLDTAYTAPNAQDWSAYMPAGSPFTGGAQARYPQAVFPPEWGTDTPYANSSNPLFNQGPPPEPAGGMPYYDIPGLLYQPGSTEYQQAFVPGNLWNYVPPELNVGAPWYSSGGHMSVGGGGGGGGGDGNGKPPKKDPQDVGGVSDQDPFVDEPKHGNKGPAILAGLPGSKNVTVDGQTIYGVNPNHPAGEAIIADAEDAGGAITPNTKEVPYTPG